jgi:hypothetical protein
MDLHNFREILHNSQVAVLFKQYKQKKADF